MKLYYKMACVGLSLMLCSAAHADWGVIDEAAVEKLGYIHDELLKINEVAAPVTNRRAAELQQNLKKASEETGSGLAFCLRP